MPRTSWIAQMNVPSAVAIGFVASRARSKSATDALRSGFARTLLLASKKLNSRRLSPQVRSPGLAMTCVTIGVVVRATGSGEACPHWPGCFAGQFLPGLDADGHVWIEWLHRTVAAIIGLLTLAMAIVAFRDHRDRRSILWPAIGAVVLVG